MPALLPAARPALGCMTDTEIAALDAPPLTPFHAFLLTVPAGGWGLAAHAASGCSVAR
jgi:hypothetical protein